jgi:hypothetical protein
MEKKEAIDFLECRRAYYASLSTDPNPYVKATKVCGYTLAESANACLMGIEALKQKPKTGRWIWTLEDWNKWECSECGFTKRTDVHVSIGYKFCPKCGIRMEGKEEKPKGE